jgi:hypothetical protein
MQVRPLTTCLLAIAEGLSACGGRATESQTTTGSGGAAGAGGTGTSDTSGGGTSASATSTTGATSATGAGGNGGAAGGSTGAGGTSDAGNVACGLPLSSECAQNPTGPVHPHSIDEFAAAISGRWLLCSDHESVFGRDGGDVGLEIQPDAHWYKLYPAQGGGTVRGAGFDEEGTWEAINVGPASDYPQLNFDIFGGGAVITLPVLASMPRAMRLDNNGVFRATYVIDASVPTGQARCGR